MEAIKGDSATAPPPVVSTKSKLRYPLRSASKPRDEKSGAAELEKQSSSASKRGRAVSNVSTSVSVLDLSGKDKSAKPPRRLSVPAKSSFSPVPKPERITPISGTRTKKSTTDQGRSDTSMSELSKSATRRKFTVLSSASHWLQQIKLSESASKHLISLGFFKLALESGCEPLQRMRDDLKLYARRHNLLELGEPAKELLSSYNILEELEQLQTSETCSQVHVSSDDDSQASSTKAGRLKPRALSSGNSRGSTVAEASKGESAQKRNPVGKNRGPSNRNSSNSNSVTDNKSNLQMKRSQRSSKQESQSEKGKIKKAEMTGKKDSTDPLPTGSQEEDKENLDDAPPTEETSVPELCA